MSGLNLSRKQRLMLVKINSPSSEGLMLCGEENAEIHKEPFGGRMGHK